MTYFTYILKCFYENGKYIYYRGHTNNPNRRLKEHKGGYGGRTTKRFKGNIIIVYLKSFETRSKAVRHELMLKNKSRKYIKKNLMFNFSVNELFDFKIVV